MAGLVAGTPTLAQDEDLSDTLTIFGGANDAQTRAARDWRRRNSPHVISMSR